MRDNPAAIQNKVTTKTIQFILATLEETPMKIEKVLIGIAPEKLGTRPEEDSWSVIEILAHLHACADIWGNSIKKMLASENPEITDQSPREWEKLASYSSIAFGDSISEFKEQRFGLLSILRNLEIDDWSRFGCTKARKHSIFSQSRRMVLHEQTHIAQIQDVVLKFKK